MININNKPWEKLRLLDVEKLLSSSVDENFFYEFKSDDEEPPKLIKEISAFANTYGGYIFL
jgi:predicted HTH transcriptional regulator